MESLCFLLERAKTQVLFQCDELLFGKPIDCRPFGHIGVYAERHVELVQWFVDFRRALLQDCQVFTV